METGRHETRPTAGSCRHRQEVLGQIDETMTRRQSRSSSSADLQILRLLDEAATVFQENLFLAA